MIILISLFWNDSFQRVNSKSSDNKIQGILDDLPMMDSIKSIRPWKTTFENALNKEIITLKNKKNVYVIEDEEVFFQKRYSMILNASFWNPSIE